MAMPLQNDEAPPSTEWLEDVSDPEQESTIDELLPSIGSSGDDDTSLDLHSCPNNVLDEILYKLHIDLRVVTCTCLSSRLTSWSQRSARATYRGDVLWGCAAAPANQAAALAKCLALCYPKPIKC